MRCLLFILALAAAACGANADVLLDQITDKARADAFASQDFEPERDASDAWGADDFTVDGSGWVIESCEWFAEFWFGQGEVHQVNFYIWTDEDDDGYADFDSADSDKGAIIAEAGMYDETLYYGIVGYTFSEPIPLEPGHYFFGVQVAMDFSAGGQHLWRATATGQQGTIFAVVNPGGGLPGGGGDIWFNPAHPNEYDGVFALYGQALQQKIDIKPGSDPNTINLGSHGVIPVAIFSFPDFDATQLNPDTIELSGSGVAVRGRADKLMAHEEDVNSDGLMDLVVQVETENLDPGELQDGIAILTGMTYDLEPFEGSDEITIVPPE